jgi:hypothetical protein
VWSLNVALLRAKNEATNWWLSSWAEVNSLHHCIPSSWIQFGYPKLYFKSHVIGQPCSITKCVQTSNAFISNSAITVLCTCSESIVQY